MSELANTNEKQPATESTGKRVGGAATGALIGAALGPIGAAVGAGVGAVAGPKVINAAVGKITEKIGNRRV
ncbi:MAG: hypothetical protein FWG25_01590 [Promicromonosporaceae bacterium]|nr:hypothetical protein [Promicromonosporaceae bacterium]